MARQFDMALALAKVGTNKTLRVTIDGNSLVLPGRPKSYTDDGLCTMLDTLPKDTKLTVTEPPQVTETGIILRPRSVQDPRDLANIVRERHDYLTQDDEPAKSKNGKPKHRGGIDPAIAAPAAEPITNGATK
jgi:hypothetical protein